METQIRISDTAISKITMNDEFIVIAARTVQDGSGEVVLGVRPNLCEYVTWLRYPRVHGNEYLHGHYFYEFDTAIRDYRTRD